MRKILEVADQVDRRFGLMIFLGAELRLGQCAGCGGGISTWSEEPSKYDRRQKRGAPSCT